MSEPEVLDVAAVMKRYRLGDRRAARRVMDKAGAFKVGARLLVHADRLRAYEDSLVSARQVDGSPESPAASRGVSERRRSGRLEREPLPVDWWREASGHETVEPGNERGG